MQVMSWIPVAGLRNRSGPVPKTAACSSPRIREAAGDRDDATAPRRVWLHEAPAPAVVGDQLDRLTVAEPEVVQVDRVHEVGIVVMTGEVHRPLHLVVEKRHVTISPFWDERSSRAVCDSPVLTSRPMTS